MDDEPQRKDLESLTQSPPIERTYLEAESTAHAYSILDDFELIANKELPPLEQELIETKCFHWDIESWCGLDDRTPSPIIEAGGHDWNILLFPRGNSQTEQVSIYLDLTNAKNNTEEYSCAQFVISLSKPSDPTKYISHHAQHRFNSDESDWGFTRFTNIEELLHGENALVENDKIRISAIIRVVKDSTGVLWHNFVNYDSKKVTGYVGLQNQGATCYMNSLFQSLYFTNSFRKAVYQIPTENDEPTKSIALALQRVFYNLQFADTAVSTTELTKSFGWDSFEAFRQHDVQEFNRVLQDNLEIKMKSTPADGAIKNLFVGRMKSYIKCINVKYESSRSEDYYDIQLNVKGCKNLEDSFKDYITEEILEGENKYMAEGHGLQDAKKGVIFESFPPVLHLQLKRFEYDMMRDMMVKINDRHEFPTEIDLEPYLSENADKTQSHVYKLHGVLVHSGDLSGGHYFAFVKPNKEDKWFKFDDDRVIPATIKEVLEDNYGGEQLGVAGMNMRPNGRPMNRFTNAYMLVYIRESVLDTILDPVTEIDIPKHLVERIEEETRLREAIRREKEEQHLFMKILVADDDTFRHNTGFDFANFDDKDNAENHIKVAKVRKDQTFGDFRENISKSIGLDTSEFRLWLMVNRQNRTVRIDIPISSENDDLTVDEVRCKYSTNQPNLRLYLERADVYDDKGNAIFPPPPESAQEILLFIKLFSPEHQLICGVGHIYAKKDAVINTVIDELKALAGLPEDKDILIYEEIKFTMIDSVDTNNTFTSAELQDGDILCVQRKLDEEEKERLLNYNYKTTVDTFLLHEMGKVQVTFSPLVPHPDLPDLRLRLHKDMNFEHIPTVVAQELKVDSDKIRLIAPSSPFNKITQKQYTGVKLGKILQNSYTQNGGNVNNRSRFMYEVLDVSLEEIESKCAVSVTVSVPTIKDAHVIDLLIPKDSGIDFLKEALVAKDTKLTNINLDHLRIYDEMDGRFDKEYDDALWRSYISNCSQVKVYAEEIPEEEHDENLDASGIFISVFHFQRSINRTHSIPFKFFIKPDELLFDTKKRLQARTGLNDNDWSKVKINIVTNDDAIPINGEDDTLFISFIQSTSDIIGLDHLDKSSKIDKTGAIFIRG